MSQDEITFKIITIGSSGVGKTSILKRYVYNTFDQNSSATLGMNFAFKDIFLKNNKKVKLKLIDTAGQEKYRSLSKSYFKNTDGVLFVFALNSLETFNDIKESIQLFIDNNNNDKIPKFLIGNKCDLKSEVDKEKIDAFLKEYENYAYKAVSAAIDDGIDDLFAELAERIFKNYKTGKQKALLLEKEKPEDKKAKCNMCTFEKYDQE